MSFDPAIAPYRLSPKNWHLGYDDVDLLVDLHEGDDGTPEQDERYDKRGNLFNALLDMNAEELRAYIGGMHGRLNEYFW